MAANYSLQGFFISSFLATMIGVEARSVINQRLGSPTLVAARVSRPRGPGTGMRTRQEASRLMLGIMYKSATICHV